MFAVILVATLDDDGMFQRFLQQKILLNFTASYKILKITFSIFLFSSPFRFHLTPFSFKAVTNVSEINFGFLFNWMLNLPYTAWNASKYGITSGPYFPVFELNLLRKSPYSVRMQENTDQK